MALQSAGFGAVSVRSQPPSGSSTGAKYARPHPFVSVVVLLTLAHRKNRSRGHNARHMEGLFAHTEEDEKMKN